MAEQLLRYRFNQLGKAIENAEKLGFQEGAALYPMVTMNGEECHNEWEITFEEIHRNGAMVLALRNFAEYTGDDAYLKQEGVEVAVAVARFWAQRVHWSCHRNAFVMLGVTGPNEYENNVNNNWYTNYPAAWCLTYASELMASLATVHRRTSATSGCASPTACVCLSRKGRRSVFNRTVSSTKTCSKQPRFLKCNAPSTKCGRGIGFFARASSSKQTCFKAFISSPTIFRRKSSKPISISTSP